MLVFVIDFDRANIGKDCSKNSLLKKNLDFVRFPVFFRFFLNWL